VSYKDPEASRPEINLKTFRPEASINLSAITYNLFYNVGVTTVARLLSIIGVSCEDFKASRPEAFINLNEITYNLFCNVSTAIIAYLLSESL
jgi:hypothetical protein